LWQWLGQNPSPYQISHAANGFIIRRLEIESQRKFPITAMFLIHILQNRNLNKIYVFSSLLIVTHYFHDAVLALVSLLLH
jgi:hypothetical protein